MHVSHYYITCRILLTSNNTPSPIPQFFHLKAVGSILIHQWSKSSFPDFLESCFSDLCFLNLFCSCLDPRFQIVQVSVWFSFTNVCDSCKNILLLAYVSILFSYCCWNGWLVTDLQLLNALDQFTLLWMYI